MNFTRFTNYLDSLYTMHNIPGVGVSLYYKHQKVFEHYTGYSDVAAKIPFTSQTLFKLYSATKLVTCTAALQLLEQGKFKLNDPLYQYIPEFYNMTVKTESGIRPAECDITVGDLFSMTSGICRNLNTDAFRTMLAHTEGRAPTLAAVKALASEPLMFDPGSHFNYGVSHDVLGGLIEAVSGECLENYFERHIFAPLGMLNTSFTVPAEDDPRMAKLYIGFHGDTETWDACGETFAIAVGSEYQSGGGGLVSSVSDYILLAESLCNKGLAVNGERILRSETVDSMRQNRLCLDALRDFEQFGGWSKSGYGYGLGVRTLMNPERNNSLAQVGEFGWDGARGCFVVIDPDAELALFYAQQEGKYPWWEWHGMVRNLAYASVF